MWKVQPRNSFDDSQNCERGQFVCWRKPAFLYAKKIAQPEPNPR